MSTRLCQADARLAVNPKLRVGTGSRGSVGRAHYIAQVAAVIDGGRIRYEARWLCSWWSKDAILLPAYHGLRACIDCMDHLRPSVYRCLTVGGSPVYIGSSVSRTRRLRQHQMRSPWWSLVAEVTFQEFPTYDDAFAAEQDAIRTERPARNRKPGVPRRQIEAVA